MSGIAAIRREVVVAEPTTAFEVFTEQIGRWWPVERFSVYGQGASVAFLEGEIVELSPSGERAVWGTVTLWQPPTAVAFTWHPGRGPEQASSVRVTFTAEGSATVVTLEHSGWEAFDDPRAARAEYEQGWPTVLERFHAELVSPAPDEPTWVALMQRPGPDAPAGESIFTDPRFAEHLSFLERMREAGHLVAAGPLTDHDGEGMTILRLHGPDALAHATRYATEDDASVTGGLLAVTIRPWRVLIQHMNAR